MLDLAILKGGVTSEACRQLNDTLCKHTHAGLGRQGKGGNATEQEAA